MKSLKFSSSDTYEKRQILIDYLHTKIDGEGFTTLKTILVSTDQNVSSQVSSSIVTDYYLSKSEKIWEICLPYLSNVTLQHYTYYPNMKVLMLAINAGLNLRQAVKSAIDLHAEENDWQRIIGLAAYLFPSNVKEMTRTEVKRYMVEKWRMEY
jgi:hypothetical protein